jgi:hypothetical protein
VEQRWCSSCRRAPEPNPAESVWNEAKSQGVERQPAKNLARRFRGDANVSPGVSLPETKKARIAAGL